MATKNYRIDRAARDALVRQITEKLERGVPYDTVLSWVLHSTRYSMGGARGLIKEGAVFAEKASRKEAKL